MEIIKEYCPQNHNCPVVGVCPTGAISQKNIFSAPEIDEEKCIQCGECSLYCPVFRPKS